MKRTYVLQKTINLVSKDIYTVTMDEALSRGICLNCKEEALPKCYSRAGEREYGISGLCEECFDNSFEE